MEESMNYVNAMFGLHGKVAIVTGSTGGLGFAMAVALLQCGATVVLNGRTEERVDTARNDMYLLTGRTSGLFAVAADMSLPDEAKYLVEQTIAVYGKIDIIVNNAGVNLPERPFENSTPEDWERVSAVNIKGPVNLTRAALPFLKQSPAGRIINISSIAGHVALANNLLYCMTKAAMIQFTKGLAAELSGADSDNSGNGNIVVNSVSPGVFETPMNAKFETGTAVRDDIVRRIPLQRLGQPTELVGIVVYLASAAASYTTGADFVVDGGFTAI